VQLNNRERVPIPEERNPLLTVAFATGVRRPSLYSRQAINEPAAPMDHDNYDDGYIRGILNTVKAIAMVGVSPKDNRPSYFAFKYLLERGYRMIPVNPGQAGHELLGQKVYAKLADIPEPVDMVDIFRAAQYAPGIVAEALALKPRPQVIWMQLGIRNDEAAKLAEDAGLKVVMNRCPKIEYGRLSSEIAWMGRGIQRMSLNRATLAGGATDASTQAQKDSSTG
jgi:predicted CoA-binding protein